MEFSQYVLTYRKSVGLANIVLIRAVVIGVHLTTHCIQYLTNNTKIQKYLGMESPADKAKLESLGYTFGVLIHAAWNTAAMLG